MAGRVLSRASDCVSWAEGLLLLTISFSPAIISGVAVQKHCRPIGCDLFSSRTVGLPAMRRTKDTSSHISAGSTSPGIGSFMKSAR